jgi:hypothetical protein
MGRLMSLTVILAFFLAACSAASTSSPPSPATNPAPGSTPSQPLPTVEPTEMEPSPVPPPNSSPEKPLPPDLNPDVGSIPSPLGTVPGEDKMMRGQVFLDSVAIMVQESSPQQYEIRVGGSLPTPCHLLRASLSGPDAKHQIQVELYSLVKPGVVCTQVLQPFDAQIPLGRYQPGKYTVWVNDKLAGEITVS